MSKQRSIGARMQRAGAHSVRIEIARDWANGWQSEHAALIARLEHAVKTDDYDELCICTGQLKALSAKKFPALKKVIGFLDGTV